MNTVSVAELVGLPVRHNRITLGHVSDVLFDESLERCVGLEVLSVAGDPTFLPWPALEFGEGSVDVPVPLSILATSELAFYRSRGLALRDLRDRLVTARVRVCGGLVDALLGPPGRPAPVTGR